MTQEMAQYMEDAVFGLGYNCDVRANYSGRGMYGKETYAIYGGA